jgi:hypothetical protein
MRPLSGIMYTLILNRHTVEVSIWDGTVALDDLRWDKGNSIAPWSCKILFLVPRRSNGLD